MMDVIEATSAYEAWLGRQLRLLAPDLAAKHKRMAADPFSFFRATFYRWAQLLPETCKEVGSGPLVLAVGDVHVENFGTWRDAEGRLVWGLNDIDEAHPLPYGWDLVRLATSALLAAKVDELRLRPAQACAAILAGYGAGLEGGGRAYVLSERHRWLRDAVTSRLRDPVAFWGALAELPSLSKVPGPVSRLLRSELPGRVFDVRWIHRRAGLGSLGRERYTVVGEWCGGAVAREAKAWAPSACAWAGLPMRRNVTPTGARLLSRAVRSPDPFFRVRSGWVVRRLSPYCGRIELRHLPRSRDEEKLVWAMGMELANLHLGSGRSIPGIREDLARLGRGWLLEMAERMVAVTQSDWKAWRVGSALRDG